MTFKIELDEQDINIVLASLAKQPYETVARVILNLQQQAQSQLPKAETPAA
jgi:hypothetical protein